MMENTLLTTSMLDETRPERAEFAIRALARFIDLAFIMLAMMTFAPMLPFWGEKLLSSITGQDLMPVEKFIPSGMDLAFLFLMFFLGSAAYHTIGSWLHGATLGKFLLGLMVRAEDGRSPTLLSSFIRSIAMLVDGFLFGIIGNFAINRSPERQRYGDRWARTIVVKMRDWRAIMLLRFAAGFVLGVMVAVLVFTAVSTAQVLYDYYVVGLYG